MTDTTVEAPATPRLKQKYNEQIVPELEKEFHYSNPMQVARVQKVVVSSLPATCAVCSTGAALSCTRGSVAAFTGGLGRSGTGGSVKSTRIVSPGLSWIFRKSDETNANEAAISST